MPMNPRPEDLNVPIPAEDKGEITNNEVGGNIPKPMGELFDPALPMYKKGDPNQAGELGKAVKIDKTVRRPYFRSLIFFLTFNICFSETRSGRTS